MQYSEHAAKVHLSLCTCESRNELRGRVQLTEDAPLQYQHQLGLATRDFEWNMT